MRGTEEDVLQEAEDQVAPEGGLGEAVHPQVCTHIVPPLPAHCLWGRGGGRGGGQLARCEEEGLFRRALYSHTNHPICCNRSPL